MKVGDRVFVRALRVVGTVMDQPEPNNFKVAYKIGLKSHLEEFERADLQPTGAKPCPHEWDQQESEPNFCLLCGMTFVRYIHTECP